MTETETVIDREHIVRFREALGWTREDLAAALGHKAAWASSIAKYEDGSASIPGEVMLAISLLIRTAVIQPEDARPMRDYTPKELNAGLLSIKGFVEWLARQPVTAEVVETPAPQAAPVQVAPAPQGVIDYEALAAVAQQGEQAAQPAPVPQAQPPEAPVEVVETPAPQAAPEPQGDPMSLAGAPASQAGDPLLPNNLWAWATQPHVSDKDVDIARALKTTSEAVHTWMSHESVSVEQIEAYVEQLKAAGAWA